MQEAKWKCLVADWFQTRKVTWTFCFIRNAVDQDSCVNKQCNLFVIAGFLLCAQSSNFSTLYGLLRVCSIEDAPKPVPGSSEDSRGLCLSAFLGNSSKNWTTSLTTPSCFHQRWLQVSTAVETMNGFVCLVYLHRKVSVLVYWCASLLFLSQDTTELHPLWDRDETT